MAPSLPRPRVRHRALAVAWYLGLAPFCFRSRIRRYDDFVRHHHSQAAALCGVLLGLLAATAAVCALNAYLLVFRRALYESVPFDTISCVLGYLATAGMLAAWLTGVVSAASGTYRDIPLAGRLARRPRFAAVSQAGGVVLCSAAILIASMAFHASSLTRGQGGPGRAYMLYDNCAVVPRWVFSLGFYRIAQAATERWGPDNVVVAPLSFESFRDAVRYGEFVFIASHGANPGDIFIPGSFLGSDSQVYDHGAIAPDEHVARLVGPRLRLVYLTACDGGSKAKQWEEVFAPARVITFDRLSAIVEHVHWLWCRGPDELRTMGKG